MNDPTANRAIHNIMRRRKAERRAKSQRRRHGLMNRRMWRVDNGKITKRS